MGTGAHQQLATGVTAIPERRPTICIIGAGNVATHLAQALNREADIVQIYSHTMGNASQLAKRIGRCGIETDKLSDIKAGADFYIVSVKDDTIGDVARNTPDSGIWAHTSGSIPMDVFDGLKSRRGVFYPLQTFSKDVILDMSSVPMFIEGGDDETAARLTTLAHKITNIVIPANSSRRKALHVAAVFACNFVNYMWSVSDDLLRKEGLGIEYLTPLLQETLRKIEHTRPSEAQTGPARRGDRHIIEDHLNQLEDEGHRAIYRLLSYEIMKHYEQN